MSNSLIIMISPFLIFIVWMVVFYLVITDRQNYLERRILTLELQLEEKNEY
jgi:hypothetical protein